MLASLKIKDIAIIDELDIRFCPHLNIITGETGAGKSIIINAVKLLSGERAPRDILRQFLRKTFMLIVSFLKSPDAIFYESGYRSFVARLQ